MGELIHSKFSSGQIKKDVFRPGEKFLFYLDSEEARALAIIGQYDGINPNEITGEALNRSQNKLFELSENYSLETILNDIGMVSWRCVFEKEINTEKYDIQFVPAGSVNFLNQIVLLNGYSKEKVLSLFVNYYIQSFINWWNKFEDTFCYLDSTSKNQVRKRAMKEKRRDILQLLYFERLEGFSHRSVVPYIEENPLEVIKRNN
ncbi:MAG: hypothetical protein KC550_07915 [Nanoarchaeota archaeon]|nr:hypothetical protein [Nanoarchaeota archaeon]